MDAAQKAEDLHLIAQALADGVQDSVDHEVEVIVIIMDSESDEETVPMGMVSTVDEDTTTMMLVSCLPEHPKEEKPAIWTPNQGITH